MTRYYLALAALAATCLVYLILCFGATFDRTDELTSDTDAERAVGKRVEGQRAGHHRHTQYDITGAE
jgi:hypothetical protein